MTASPKTDELVEKIARALWEDWRTNCRTAGEGARGCSWDDLLGADPDNTKIADIVADGRSQARAALSAIEAEGYVVVPRKPTEEMLASCGNGECAKWAPGAWANYIAASPKP